MEEELQLIKQMENNDSVIRNTYKALQQKYANEYIGIDEGKVIAHSKKLQELLDLLKNMKKDTAKILIQFIPDKGVIILF
jgi:hypothetical protein